MKNRQQEKQNKDFYKNLKQQLLQFDSNKIVHEPIVNVLNVSNKKKHKKRERILFFLFFVFHEKIKFSIFLSQWPFSLFVTKTCLSDRIFPEFFFAWGWLTKFEKTCHSDSIFSENFFACGGLIILRVTFENSFFTQKVVGQTTFWVKKEFPNVTHKLISQPQVKKFREKYGRWDKFSRRKEKTVPKTKKLGCLFTKKNGKIIVLVTVNSVVSLQKTCLGATAVVTVPARGGGRGSAETEQPPGFGEVSKFCFRMCYWHMF